MPNSQLVHQKIVQTAKFGGNYMLIKYIIYIFQYTSLEYIYRQFMNKIFF